MPRRKPPLQQRQPTPPLATRFVQSPWTALGVTVVLTLIALIPDLLSKPWKWALGAAAFVALVVGVCEAIKDLKPWRPTYVVIAVAALGVIATVSTYAVLHRGRSLSTMCQRKLGTVLDQLGAHAIQVAAPPRRDNWPLAKALRKVFRRHQWSVRMAALMDEDALKIHYRAIGIQFGETNEGAATALHDVLQRCDIGPVGQPMRVNAAEQLNVIVGDGLGD